MSMRHPPYPDALIEDLLRLAETSADELGIILPSGTIEADAAAVIETATRALREISEGAPDPRLVAYVALMAIAARGS